MIKLTRRTDGFDSDCFIDSSEIVMIVAQIDGLAHLTLRCRNYIDGILQSPAEVMELIKEAGG